MARFNMPFLALLALASVGWSQAVPPAYHVERLQHRSGLHDGDGVEARMVHEYVVHVPGALWLRLAFADSELGSESWVRLWSLADGGEQVLDSRSMQHWQDASAVFNGDAVVLQLFAAPGDTDVFVDLEHVLVGDPAQGLPESLCGADSRVPSGDNRVGRLFFGGCTAWRVNHGAFLTAGHCVDFDPDQVGPALPDGTLDLTGVVEFNVPPSTASGGTVAAAPNDQYPIDLASVVWRYDGEGQGLGKDWAVFSVFPNSNTSLLPHQAYGPGFRMTREVPGGSATVRITGFGLDNTPLGSTGAGNAQNFTNQTSTGPYGGESSSGSDIWLKYAVDTLGGNSGGPVLWESLGLTFGIHTNGGCDTAGGNHGTSFEVDALESALQTFLGPVVRYVDVGHPLPVSPAGTVFRPYLDLSTAVQNTPAGGTVAVIAGSYPAASGNSVTVTGSMTILAPMGGVVIGD
ncbi:MAG TPA: hypothetical protein VMT18_15855 [Planctomycetota bacterium]|nr:hypothetical protein [Planctomycetota bacterium]